MRHLIGLRRLHLHYHLTQNRQAFQHNGSVETTRDTKSHRCYLLQELVVQSVGAVKLEHHVSSKGVFNAADNVFRFSLRQLHRLGRLEEWTQTLELWDGCQLLYRREIRSLSTVNRQLFFRILRSCRALTLVNVLA